MNPTKRKARAEQKRREARVHRNAVRRKRMLIVVDGKDESMPVTDEDLGIVEKSMKEAESEILQGV